MRPDEQPHTIRQLGGEFALIERIAQGIGKESDAASSLRVGIGDDAAVLRVSEGKVCIVTTDLLFEDVHFRLDWTDPYSLGWKAVAVNLSDIAAMGAEPTFAFISIALPKGTTVEFVDALYQGMRDIGARFGSVIAGGDTNTSPDRMVINVAQLGEADEEKVILRSRAVPGDLILATGTLGDSAAGLALLRQRGRAEAEAVSLGSVRAHLVPVPRIAEARAGVRAGGITAMMDISDGLCGDLAKLCQSSGVGATIHAAMVPVGSGARRAATALPGSDPLQWALSGGEDYELLFSASPERTEAVRSAIIEATGTPVTIVGSIREGEGVLIDNGNGTLTPPPSGSGWDHFTDDAAA